MSTLLTPAEVMTRLGISRQTLVRWENGGRLVRDASSSRPRYRQADVDAVAVARAAEPGPRTAMLRAAADLLRERGVDGCTLDAVAERAGLSRAGVAYHHPTKEHLLEALVRRFLDDFDSAWREEVDRTEPGPGRLSRAYTAQTLRPAGDGLGAAVLACALDSPPLRRRVGGALRSWYDRLSEEDIADGLDGGGLRACLAADGLWVLGLLHVAPLSRSSRLRAFPADLLQPQNGSAS